MSHIIAISNQKGGVGKTTTAVNLAACLGAAGFPVLLVDMDPQANATSSVGVNPATLKTSLYHYLIGIESAQPLALHDSIPNLSILPSSMDLAAAEIEFRHVENPSFRLSSILESLKTRFDYIIIDSPPSLNQLSLNALVAAHCVLAPVQAEFMALEGLTHVLNTIDRVRQNYNESLQLLGIVVTMYDGRTRLATEVVHELQREFQEKVFQTKITRSVRLSEAPGHGQPIIYYDARSAGALAYTQLSEEVIHACEETRPGTGFGRSVCL